MSHRRIRPWHTDRLWCLAHAPSSGQLSGDLLDELLNLLLFALIGLEVVALTVDWTQVWIGFLAIPVVLFARLASVGIPSTRCATSA
jgi:NhaP-type Na+/H+ or K+/H+ antiporter